MRESILMNRDWRYYFGEPSYRLPKYTSSDQQYRGSRAENARGPARRDFMDEDWRRVNLPHDFVAENGLSDADPFGGEHFDFPRDRGSAWYRRYFRLEEADRGRRIVLHFEAVATLCQVYVNSMLLKTNHTAGIGFDVDITDVARFGTDYNVVSVHCDCHDYEAWYYEGGGITRNVWLVKTDPLRVALWGTYVKCRRLEGDAWRLDVETELDSRYNAAVSAQVRSRILDEGGAAVAESLSEAQVLPARGAATVRQQVTLQNPALWDTQACHLYTLRTEILKDGQVVDALDTAFGIRELRFDADEGFFLNGKPVTIYGFANHMLYLGVGEAMSDSMREFQMRTLRDMGANGFRCAHSPHAEGTYDYCDRYGLLVMDENRLFQPSDIVQDEVARMVRRDRNHPSVIMWSIYNEEDTVTNETGRRVFNTLAAVARKYDDTRPMTGATSYGIFTEGAHDDYDLIGINHETAYFDALHRAKPGKPIFCSEEVMPLGEAPAFHPDAVPGQDVLVSQKPYVMGGFHFTGWAYGPEEHPILDCIGHPGPLYYGYQAYLKPETPLACVAPPWNFPGQEGQEVRVCLPNNGEEVEVALDGVALGRYPTDLYAVTPVTLTYQPGTLTVTAYKDGKVWAQGSSTTPGAPAALRLRLENGEPLRADDQDVAIVTCELVDAQGRLCNRETGLEVTFQSNGAGEFLTTLSTRDDGFQGRRGPAIRLVRGQAQALYRSLSTAGDLVVRAQAPGLPEATLTLPRSREGLVPQAPAVPNNFVLDWAISRLYVNGLDEQRIMKEHMVDRWEHIDTQGSPDVLYGTAPSHFGPPAPGMPFPAGTTFHYAYYTRTAIPDMGDPGDAILGLHFEGLDGPANIYVVGAGKTATGRHPANSPWAGHYRPEMIVDCAPFAPGDEVEIWVFIHDANRVTGIGWPVRWTYTTPEAIAALDAKTAREWAWALEKK